MKKKTLKLLYYLAWTIGIIAAVALIYGIIIQILK